MTHSTEVAHMLAALAGRGVGVTATAGTIQVRPASLLTPDECGWVKQNATAIRAYLE